ncbi:MAG: GAF domain-containing protein [Chloroflexi bacterium]|nr:GAF domain-containing protein [Chloroflexota bacterium]
MTKKQRRLQFLPTIFSLRTIRQRLFLSFSLIGLFQILILAVVIWQVNRLNNAVFTLQQASVQVAVVVEVRQDSNELLATVNRLLPVEDADIFEAEVTDVLQSLAENYESMNALATEKTGDSAFDALLSNVSNSVDGIINVSETMIRQANAEQWASVQIRIGVLTGDTQQISNQVSRLVDLAQMREQVVSEQLVSARRIATFHLSSLMLVSLAFIFFILWQVMHSIIRPIEQLSQGVTQLATGSFHERVPVVNQDELGQLADAFNNMAERLQVSRNELEQRIVERTHALEVSTELSRRLSTTLDQNQLVIEVVEQVRQAFDYYHVHIYMFDEARNYLVMVGGTGEAGQAMLNREHKIVKGKGLVGRAAETKAMVLISDVAQESGWLPNPLLPDTKSEIALPIIIEERVLGVLDVQQNVVGGLTEYDISLLQSVASQVAITLRNIRLFEQAQVTADREVTLNLIGQHIQAATDIESVLRIATRELGQVLGANRTSVQVHNPGSSIVSAASNGRSVSKQRGSSLSEKRI